MPTLIVGTAGDIVALLKCTFKVTNRAATLMLIK